ncbi:MAG: hypothetical protein IPJ13_16910 [Saprospiraceae bacterium]|nr:hypothetical protein [Saprospiraceae bacterium]
MLLLKILTILSLPMVKKPSLAARPILNILFSINETGREKEYQLVSYLGVKDIRWTPRILKSDIDTG